METNAPKATASKIGFLSLPPELRLMIYDILASTPPAYAGGHLNGTITLNMNARSIVYLCHLYQVCRQTREDIKERFQHSVFSIGIDALYLRESFRTRHNEVLAKNLQVIVPNAKRVSLSVRINYPNTYEFDQLVEGAKKVIAVLEGNSELRSLSFTTTVEDTDSSQWVKDRTRALRRSASKKGRDMGKSWLAIELDFVKSVVEMLEENEVREAIVGKPSEEDVCYRPRSDEEGTDV